MDFERPIPRRTLTGKLTKDINTLKEIFFYRSLIPYHDPTKGVLPFMVEEAGVTVPDPDYRIKRHNKQGRLVSFDLVTDGVGYLEYNGARQTVRENTLMIIRDPAACRYWSDRAHPWTKKWLNAKGTFLDGLFFGFHFNDPVTIMPIENAEPIFDEIHSVLSRLPLEADPESERVETLILQLFQLMHVTRRAGLREKKPNAIDPVRAYIDDHFIDPDISVRTVAEHFFISERSLCRMFRHYLQMSPLEYIAYRRVEYAKFLLLSEDCTVERVTSILGYQNSAYFRKLFTRFTGLSPSAWRRENREVLSEPTDL